MTTKNRISEAVEETNHTKPKIRLRTAEPILPDDCDAEVAIPAEWGEVNGLVDGKLYRMTSLGGRRWELIAE